MRWLRSLPKRLLLWMIRFYRANLSALHPGCCRFTPTCSQYALEAVEKYGASRGAGWRFGESCAAIRFTRAAMTPYPDTAMLRSHDARRGVFCEWANNPMEANE